MGTINTTSSAEFPIQLTALLESWKSGKLNTRPGYQRKYVWSQKKASRLIESVLRGRYIPPILLNRRVELDNEDLPTIYFDSVLDGQQRVRTLLSYYDGWNPFESRVESGPSMVRKKWKLTGLVHLPELNGLAFSELPPEYKKMLACYVVRTVLIEGNNKKDLIEVFTCLNEGTVGMNANELRNAVCAGPMNRVLIELSSQPDFLESVRLKNDKRMAGPGYVLRWLAFFRNGASNFVAKYHGSKTALQDFLDDEMSFWEKNCTKENRRIVIERFLLALESSREVFGKIVFAKSNSEQGAISVLAFEVLMAGFSLYNSDAVMANKEILRARFLDMCANDSDFIRGIDRNTAEASRVLARHRSWGLILEEILGSAALLPPAPFGNPTSLVPTITAADVARKKKAPSAPKVRAVKAKAPKKIAAVKAVAGMPPGTLFMESLPAVSRAPSALEVPLPFCADPGEDPTAELSLEVPLVVEASHTEESFALVGKTIYDEMVNWPVDERICASCGACITDKQLKHVTVSEADKVEGLWNVSHAAGDCVGGVSLSSSVQ